MRPCCINRIIVPLLTSRSSRPFSSNRDHYQTIGSRDHHSFNHLRGRWRGADRTDGRRGTRRAQRQKPRRRRLVRPSSHAAAPGRPFTAPARRRPVHFRPTSTGVRGRGPSQERREVSPPSPGDWLQVAVDQGRGSGSCVGIRGSWDSHHW